MARSARIAFEVELPDGVRVVDLNRFRLHRKPKPRSALWRLLALLAATLGLMAWLIWGR